MGCFHVEQPLLGQESVRPTIVGRSSTVVVLLAMSLEQNATQATSNQMIQAAKHVRVGRVFEVFKPAPRRPIDRRDDDSQAMPVLTRRLGANRVLDLLQALVTRPAFATLKVIAQKVEPFLRPFAPRALSRFIAVGSSEEAAVAGLQ